LGRIFSIRVIDDDGHAIPDANVTIDYGGLEGVSSATTNDRGWAQFTAPEAVIDEKSSFLFVEKILIDEQEVGGRFYVENWALITLSTTAPGVPARMAAAARR
jgi:uncharacterized GH25 family protein